MPTYQYACTACEERTEVVQKFTDDPLTICEACGGSLRKVYSAVGIVFKGSGFYRTDSRNGAVPAGTKDSSGNGASSSGDGKGGDGQAGDGKVGDGKSGDGKSGDGKSAETAKKAQTVGAGSSANAGSKVT